MVSKFVLITLSLYLFSLALTAQEISYFEKLASARNLDKIPSNQIARLKIVLKELEKTEHKDTIGFAHYFIAYRYAVKVQPIKPDSAIIHARLALDNFKSANYIENRSQRSLNYLITSLIKINQYPNAIKAYLEYGDNYLETDKNVRAEAQIVRNVSLSYRNIGEHEGALNFINKFLEKNKHLSIPDKELSDIYLERSNIEYNLESYKMALENIEIAINYEAKANNHNDINRISNLINQKATILSALGNQKEAITLFNTFLEKKISTKERFALLSNTYNSLFESGKYELAAPYAKQAFDLSTKFDNSIYNTFVSIINLSESYRTLNQFDSAIIYGNHGIEYLLKQQEKGINVNHPLLKQYYNQVLNYISKFEQTDQSLALDSARISMTKIDALVPLHLDNLLFEGSLLQNKQEIATWYDTGVELAYMLNSPDLFIKYADQTKTLSSLTELQIDIKHVKLRDSIYTEIQSLISNESQLELKLSLNSSDLNTDSLNAQLFENREQQRVLLTSLKGLNQKENKLRKNIEDLHFSDPDLSILYYHQTDSILYAAHITHKTEELIKIGKVGEAQAYVSSFNQEIRNKNYSAEKAQLLYSQLIQPFIGLSARLMIIPDQELSLLPFETLITPKGSYLIEEHEISYALSLQQYLKSSKQNNPSIHQFNIISPDYDDNFANTFSVSKGLSSLDKQFSFLEHTKSEVKFLEDKLSASSIEGFNISRDTFFDILTGADVFHFTGHAISLLGNDHLSFLALGKTGDQVEQDIFIREIAEHKTEASLVTLNACNTGVGRILKGEGVYNLARSFFKAGAKAVVSGLWEIDDHSSSKITKSFYTYLKEGKRKSKAMQLAKLDYLENVVTDNEKDPYYWSGLILTGNTAPIYSSSTKLYFLLLGLLVIVGFGYYQRNRSNT